MFTRRSFLATSAAVVASPFAAAIDPVKRPGLKADIKLGVAAYGFRQLLDLKKPTITLFDFIDMAADWPVAGSATGWARVSICRR